MKAQQVFLSYNRSGPGHAAIADIYRYCPRCGRELAARAEDNRPSCPECGFVFYGNPLPGGFIEYEEDFLTAGIRIPG